MTIRHQRFSLTAPRERSDPPTRMTDYDYFKTNALMIPQDRDLLLAFSAFSSSLVILKYFANHGVYSCRAKVPFVIRL